MKRHSKEKQLEPQSGIKTQRGRPNGKKDKLQTLEADASMKRGKTEEKSKSISKIPSENVLKSVEPSKTKPVVVKQEQDDIMKIEELTRKRATRSSTVQKDTPS